MVNTRKHDDDDRLNCNGLMKLKVTAMVLTCTDFILVICSNNRVLRFLTYLLVGVSAVYHLAIYLSMTTQMHWDFELMSLVLE